MAVGVPLSIFLFLLAIPYLDQARDGAGRWFTSTRGQRITLLTALYTALTIPILIALSTAYPPRELLRGQAPDWVAQGLIPGGALLLLIVAAVDRVAVLQAHHAREAARVVHRILHRQHSLHADGPAVSRAGLQSLLAVGHARRLSSAGRFLMSHSTDSHTALSRRLFIISLIGGGAALGLRADRQSGGGLPPPDRATQRNG